MSLDFSELTDDQIVELATAVFREAFMRSPAVAAATKESVITERDRLEASYKGTEQAKIGALKTIQDVQRLIDVEVAKARERADDRARFAVLLKKAAQIVSRELHDVTLIFSEQVLYLNAGTEVMKTGVLHLLKFNIKTSAIKTSWALERKKWELNAWAEQVIAVFKVMKISQLTIKGIDYGQ